MKLIRHNWYFFHNMTILTKWSLLISLYFIFQNFTIFPPPHLQYFPHPIIFQDCGPGHRGQGQLGCPCPPWMSRRVALPPSHNFLARCAPAQGGKGSNSEHSPRTKANQRQSKATAEFESCPPVRHVALPCPSPITFWLFYGEGAP